MKIQIDGVDLFELTPTQKKVIANDLPTAILEEDLVRRMHWALGKVHDKCYKKFREDHEKMLADNGLTAIPIKQEEFVALVKKQPNYKKAFSFPEIKENQALKIRMNPVDPSKKNIDETFEIHIVDKES